MLIGDYGNSAPDQRQDRMLADEVPVALVVGMHGDGRVAQHGLGPRRRHGDEAALLALDRVAEVPEVAVDLLLLDLEVGDRGVEARVPVHQALVAVNQIFVVKPHEHTQNGFVQAVIHREALTAPVRRSAEAADLVGGIVFTRAKNPLPTWQSIRPLAFLATP